MNDKSRDNIPVGYVPVRIAETLNKYLEICKRIFKESNKSPRGFNSELLTDIYDFSRNISQPMRSTILCYDHDIASDRYSCWFRGNVSKLNITIIGILRQFVGDSNVTTYINRPYELILDDVTIESIHSVYDMSEEEFILYLKMVN